MAHISNTTPPWVLGSFAMSTRKTKEVLLQEPDVSKTGNPTKYTPDHMMKWNLILLSSLVQSSLYPLKPSNKVLDWSQILCWWHYLRSIPGLIITSRFLTFPWQWFLCHTWPIYFCFWSKLTSLKVDYEHWVPVRTWEGSGRLLGLQRETWQM